MVITKDIIINTLKKLELEKGDWILVHSSLKSAGYIEGGPDTLIDAFLEIIGSSGTLIMPTLSQKNWDTVYKDWSMDRPSDVGLITEVFRKREGVLRSNQQTHSVAAKGPDAKFITDGHTAFGPRFGAFGNYAFSHSSPWQKMYDHNAKIVFWGASINSNTMKHLAEYMFFEKKLDELEKAGGNNTLKNELWHYDDKMYEGVWTYLDSFKLYDEFEKAGLVKKTKCGNAEIFCIPAGETTDLTLKIISESTDDWFDESTIKWINKIDKFTKK